MRFPLKKERPENVDIEITASSGKKDIITISKDQADAIEEAQGLTVKVFSRFFGLKG